MSGGIPSTPSGHAQEAAAAAGWESEERAGDWVKVTRTFRDGSSQDWWSLEVVAGPFGPEKKERVVIATTDPLTLPELSTLYLVTNLPAPGTPRAQESSLAEASVVEVVHLYGLRLWVEQSYKQVKHALGWSQYQVRSDQAIRRHWQLVWCAFSFCWYHASHSSSALAVAERGDKPSEREELRASDDPPGQGGTGKKNQRGRGQTPSAVLAQGIASGLQLVGAVDHAQALLDRLVASAPTT